MKPITTVLAVLSLFVVNSPPATSQDEDCWHYENGDAYIVGGVDIPPDMACGVVVSGSYAYVQGRSGPLTGPRMHGHASAVEDD